MKRENAVKTRDILNQIEATEAEIETIKQKKWVFAKKYIPFIEQIGLSEIYCGIFEQSKIELSKEDIRTLIDLRKNKIMQLEKELDEIQNTKDVIGGMSEFANDIRQAMQDLIDHAPTVDAEPVRYGEWIDDNVGNHDPRDRWVKCSLCGYSTTDRFSKEYHYCPNCGKKMRKKGVLA